MTYEGIFEKCKTIGECRRAMVVMLDEAESDVTIFEIKQKYKERCEAIRSDVKNE